MNTETAENLQEKIRELETRLAEAEQLIEAIKDGEVDAFAVKNGGEKPEIYTLQSGDYAYRVLIEKFGEGALNITEDGLIVYTNAYFTDLIGIPYEKVMGRMLSQFIADDCLGEFANLFSQALAGSSKGEIVLQVNNTKIPVYVSLTSLKPNLATVGIIITDLTEKKKHEEVVKKYQHKLTNRSLELADKNLELERQNKELASFTYIASHDLQEPLRKIQAFSSRIQEMERDNLSETGDDYFTRIIVAASRMQNLINALLSYSRTSTADIIYLPTDLNKVLKEVTAGIIDEIKAKNATIISDGLPTLNLIELQFYQLLCNIISNALKYSRPNVPPVIKITATKVTENEMEANGDLSAGNYWRIDIADNGIGFEQEHAEKIFELFQRLHGRSEYEGTGIGLAICQKIAQNHKGFITATGVPNQGSTFRVFLPITTQLV